MVALIGSLALYPRCGKPNISKRAVALFVTRHELDAAVGGTGTVGVEIMVHPGHARAGERFVLRLKQARRGNLAARPSIPQQSVRRLCRTNVACEGLQAPV